MLFIHYQAGSAVVLMMVPPVIETGETMKKAMMAVCMLIAVSACSSGNSGSKNAFNWDGMNYEQFAQTN